MITLEDLTTYNSIRNKIITIVDYYLKTIDSPNYELNIEISDICFDEEKIQINLVEKDFNEDDVIDQTFYLPFEILFTDDLQRAIEVVNKKKKISNLHQNIEFYKKEIHANKKQIIFSSNKIEEYNEKLNTTSQQLEELLNDHN